MWLLETPLATEHHHDCCDNHDCRKHHHGWDKNTKTNTSKAIVQMSIFTIIIIQILEKDNIICMVIKGSLYHTWTRHEFKTYFNEEKYINAKLQNVFDAFGKRYDENQMESCTVTKYNRQRIISTWPHKEWYKIRTKVQLRSNKVKHSSKNVKEADNGNEEKSGSQVKRGKGLQ